MNNSLFLLLIAAITLLGVYNALFPVPASTAFIRFFGLSGFLLLCVSLMMGPLAIIWPGKFNKLLETRRAVGIACFVFVLIHFLLIAASRFDWNMAAALGTANPLVTIPATAIILALALTSSDYAVKSLGPGLWKSIQRFNYLAFVLSFAHFILLSNGLFISAGGKAFINISELALVALGMLAALLQIAGFIIIKKKRKISGTSSPT